MNELILELIHVQHTDLLDISQTLILLSSELPENQQNQTLAQAVHPFIN